MTGDGKGTLAYYIALLLARGPSFRDGCHSFHKHIVDITTQKLYKMGKLPEPPEVVKKFIKNDDITSVLNVEIFPDVSIKYMLNLARQFGESLCSKKWEFYLSPEGKNDCR